ncbi:MAG: nucleotidyl transferase AbiEii/AbiGii toxin family protein [Fodinibius sp.]|nr:nucleotidyl transferase AbiEii/AbiGii toxin family protein [Fodinibius sp.]
MSSSLEQSIKDRLKNIARETRRDYNFVAIQYLQERFLARLEKSRYRDNLILKGALLLVAYNIPVVRPSKDIDFKGEGASNDLGQIEKVVQDIAEINLEDGVEFSPEDIDIEQITEDSEYDGVRIKISATVAGDKHWLQLDIGFGDTIIDGPVDMEYPAMLEFAAPNIKVYSIESSIAEKLEAIVSLGTFGSRMKDYFDVWFLITNHDLEKDRLKKAISATFSQRQTPVDDFEYIFSEDFKTNRNKHQQWQAFLNRTTIESDNEFSSGV